MAESHFTHLVETLIATIASHLSASLYISLPSLLSLTNSGEWLLMRLSLLLLDLIITSFIFIILFLVSSIHLRRSRSIGGSSGLLVVNLVNWEIHLLLTLVGSSNSGRVHVEAWVSFGVFELTESLIGRILCEGALSPHRGNRRLMSCCSVPFEFMEFMRFIHPMMLRGMSMRMWLRLRRVHYILLFTSNHCWYCFSCGLVGLLPEDTLETFFVPNEGIVNLRSLSEHSILSIA